MENNKKKMTIELIISIISIIIGIGLALGAYFMNYGKNPFSKGEPIIYVLYTFGALLILCGSLFLIRVIQEFRGLDRKLSVREMTLIAFQSAITILLYYFAKFNLPIFPGWLDIQVSEIPAVITSFIYGPGAGAIVIFIRFLLKLPGTMTVGIGEFADLVLGLILVIFAGAVYKKHRTLKGAIVGMSLGIICATIVACVLNYLVLMPAYINIAGFKMSTLLKMMPEINGLNESNFMVYYIFVGVLPFNLFRYIIVFIITFVLYKQIHKLFDVISGRGKRKLS